MSILDQAELELREEEIIERIRAGEIFIYPTDTIYGIGCNALDSQAVRKIRALKERYSNPFSVIAPSLQWIKDNCIINSKVKKSLEQLPGPYTLILQLKKNKSVAKELIPDTDFLGVRYPDHWIAFFVEKIGLPIVTTSANKSGQPFMTSLEDLDQEIKKEVSFIIYEGEKKSRPSKIINVNKEEIIER